MGSSVAAMGMVSESKFHVLAVDDSVIDRKLIERLLKTSSYQVTTVDSGSKALEFLGYDPGNNSIPSISPNHHHHHHHQEVDVNLVITDYCMPGMTGYDLLKKIKGSTALRNIPVVIMSSENVPARINRCLEEGAEEFFLKPVRLSDVNRLRPHMLKTKLKCDKPERTEEDEPDSGSQSQALEQQQQQQQHQQEQLRLQPQQIPTPLQDQDRLQSVPLLPTPQQEPEQLQLLPPTPPQQSNNNKRKAMEDGLSPDRTRPRYNGITTMV